jgi:hypothetical protein
VRAEQREPEVVQLIRMAGDAALRPPVLRDALGPIWADVQAAGVARRSRRASGS